MQPIKIIQKRVIHNFSLLGMKKAALATYLFTVRAFAAHKIRTTADDRLTQAPKVNIDECKRACVFENEDDYLCFTTAPPAFRIGWEWD